LVVSFEGVDSRILPMFKTHPKKGLKNPSFLSFDFVNLPMFKTDVLTTLMN